MQQRRSRRRRATFLVLPLALVISGSLVYGASVSAFTATTQNPSNTWSTGAIALSDDDSGSAMFSATGLSAGSTGSRCIKIDYTGTLPATVALYGSGSGALAPYLNLTVETGTGGSFAAGDPCTGFTPAATVFSGTLTQFLTSHTNFATGAPTTGRWTPTGNASLVHRFTYTVANDNNSQDKTATATFTWEARTS